MTRLRGRIALVTGAQQGIGAAICEAMAREGADVAVNWLDDEAAGEAVAAKARGHGVRAAAIRADIGTASGRAHLQSETERLLGLPDILVCNAGIFPRADFLDLTEEMWDATHDVNLKATAFQAQLFARALVKAGKPGAAVTMSSSAVRGDPRGAHYSATKTGLLGLTRSIALALAAHGIRINAIAPGLTDTAQPRYGNTEEQIAERVRAIPISRLGQPQDIAEMACFLVSDQASWITGQVYHVNGGLYMP
ncbi:SDR family NAD(P)-dependent oxidoreductase [Roseococcus sp. YIM B11640]|uniref:SDR family NAD(P)-dependent oxidoreductase n=1 Tax=Roseococcus sp. YIM B11640 TaxID=3133973 RepID=UPI003C7BF828